MDKIFEQALLYDFYGELLTSHQQSIYEDAVFHDMSLSEIAEEQGISRQGVHDLIKRCDKILQGYESKLHLVERFSCAKEKIREIVELTKDMEDEAVNLDKLQAENEAEVSQGAGISRAAEVSQDIAVRKTDSEKTDLGMRMQRIRELSMELMEDW